MPGNLFIDVVFCAGQKNNTIKRRVCAVNLLNSFGFVSIHRKLPDENNACQGKIKEKRSAHGEKNVLSFARARGSQDQ